MRTWDDYKNYVRSSGGEGAREIEECESLSRALSSALDMLRGFGLQDFPASRKTYRMRRANHIKEE